MAGIPGLDGMITSGGVDTTLGVLKMVLYGGLGGLLVWAAWYYMSFNVKVRLNIRNGSGFMTKWDKGRFKKDKNNPGVFKFQMLKDKRWDMPLDRDYVGFEKKGWGRMGLLVEFAEDEQGRLQPVRLLRHENLLAWSGWNNNAMEFTTAKIREYADRFKKGDFWSKYGGLIQMAFLGFLLIILLVLFREQAKVVEGLGSVANSLDLVAKSLHPVVQNSTGAVVPQVIGG